MDADNIFFDDDLYKQMLERLHIKPEPHRMICVSLPHGRNWFYDMFVKSGGTDWRWEVTYITALQAAREQIERANE